MKEIKLVSNTIWQSVALVVTALIIAGASIFIALEFNKTQWDIANLQKDAEIEASLNISEGMNEIGSGICKTSTKQIVFC